MADKDRGKAAAPTDRGGWWGRCKEGAGGPWGLEPGVLLLLLLCPFRLRPLYAETGLGWQRDGGLCGCCWWRWWLGRAGDGGCG